MTAKPPVAFTAARKELYLEHLRKIGLKWKCAELVGVTYSTVMRHRKLDPVFEELFQEANQTYIDEVLIGAALQRGINGVEEPIIGGKERDQIVAYVRKYSDPLLAMLIKGQRQEEYGALAGKAGGEGGPTTGVMFIPQAAPTTNSDWESKFGEAAKGQSGRDE